MTEHALRMKCALEQGKAWNRFAPEYSSYRAMIQRCYNPNNIRYKNYGAKGISVCPKWKGSFKNFLADVGPKPSPKHSIDRYPNRNGNYEPGNVRWATRKEQDRNLGRNKPITFNGRTMLLCDWAESIGMSDDTLRGRLMRGWSFEKAITTPLHPTHGRRCA